MTNDTISKPEGGTFGLLFLLVLVVLITFAIGSGTNNWAAIASYVFFPAALALYFFPALVAATFKHPSRNGIALLTLFLGWTVLGWVIALIWSYTMPKETAELASSGDTKACPFCAEDIRAEAIKCKHCGSDLRGETT